MKIIFQCKDLETAVPYVNVLRKRFPKDSVLTLTIKLTPQEDFSVRGAIEDCDGGSKTPNGSEQQQTTSKTPRLDNSHQGGYFGGS